MAQQIKFFEENRIDIKNSNVTLTVTDGTATNTGQSIVDFIRNRNNRSAWLTTGSNDAANTQLDIDWADERSIDNIILVKHNFKAFTIQYWDGAAYQDFSTAISETTNTDETTNFTFNSVSTSKLRLIITGTQTANADKQLYQFIATLQEGQLTAWPEIQRPTHAGERKVSTMLSGKRNILQQIGRFSCSLRVRYWKNTADLTLIEKLYFGRKPMLMWLCGGDETQFATIREGFRLEDLYLMRPSNDYQPNWVGSVYTTGNDITIRLDEVVD